MKTLFTFLIATLMLACGTDKPTASDTNGIRGCPALQVHFSPRGGITESMVQSIESSSRSIYIVAFSFTSVPIAEALVRAKERGVVIEVVADRENLGNKNSVVKRLHENNITVFIDSKHAIQHNKVIIIDGSIVFTGSANFSKGAEENNAENSIEITDMKIAELYFDNFNLHKEHSRPYSSNN
jgi:phosphatidylserine/phosphatidylglycerophosphate/cardiolipin synthase-like enzyme